MFRRPAGGLLELAATVVVLWGLASTTPLGALVDRALGRKPRPLASYFAFDRGAALPLPVPADGSTELAPTAAVAAAHRAGASPELVAAAALLLSEGRRDGGVPDVVLSPPALRALAAAGIDPNRTRGGARDRLDALAAALPALGHELGSPDAALAALAVGPELVRLAVARARDEGHRAPASLDAFLPHLPRAERHAAQDLADGVLALAGGLGLGWPLPAQTRVSSRFGWRDHPVTGGRRLHTGVDLAIPSGTDVRATGAGVVRRAGEDAVNGRFVVVDHGHGLSTAYCHAEQLLVSRGEPVAVGQVILRSGSTGRSTGPHLHYQVELGGTAVDPLRLQPPGGVVATVLGGSTAAGGP